MIWNILINIGIFICCVLTVIGSFTLLVFIICSCKVASNCDEEHRKLDPKELDNDEKWDNNIYDEDFVKKEDANEKRDNLGK